MALSAQFQTRRANVANIIQLENFRNKEPPRRRCGVVFPQLYRVRGFYFDVEGDKPVPSDRPAPVCYTLSPTDECGLAAPTWEAIDRLDWAIDHGWLIVRHHRQLEHAYGYLSAMLDHANELSKGKERLFQDKDGLYTILHRDATRDAPDHLLVFIAQQPDPHAADAKWGAAGAGWVDCFEIVHADGSISDDPDLLMPE